MQLPRGTFREIQKHQKTGDVLEELARGRFSGICSISCRDGISTLVLKSGKCILAEYNSFKGDAALEELLNAIANEDIDAALSTLDEAQIQLSLEFNKACRIIKEGKIGQSPQAPAPLPRQEPHETARHEPAKKPPAAAHFTAPVLPVKTVPKPAPSQSAPAAPVRSTAVPLKAPPVPDHKPIPVPTHGEPATKPASQIPPSQRTPVPKAEPPRGTPGADQPAPDQGATSFDSDIDTFDTMDLENVTDKIRNDCKTMIKQLHLEHLMER